MSDDVINRTLSVHQEHELLSALERAGITSADAQKVIASPNNFVAESVIDFIRQCTPAFYATPAQAAAIMGSNFIGIEPLQRHLGVKLSPKSKKLFDKVPFSAKVLQQCADTHVLVACGALSLLDVWLVQKDLWYCKSVPWYKAECFATTKVKAGWQLVRKNAMPDSTSKAWDEQNLLLGADESVPSASVLAQAIFLIYLETNEHLFQTIYVRTSSVDSNGSHMGIGSFVTQGLFVNSYSVGHRGSNLGLVSSRKYS